MKRPVKGHLPNASPVPELLRAAAALQKAGDMRGSVVVCTLAASHVEKQHDAALAAHDAALAAAAAEFKAIMPALAHVAPGFLDALTETERAVISIWMAPARKRQAKKAVRP